MTGWGLLRPVGGAACEAVQEIFPALEPQSGISASVNGIKGAKNLRGRRESRDCFIPQLLAF